MQEPVVVCKGVTKRFAENTGVFDLDLELPPGVILGFIGPSGSGKTTTVRLMTGLMKPDAGSILVLGVSPRDFDITTRARLGYMPQQGILYPDLTLGENLDFAASLYGMPLRRRRRISALTEFLGLEGVLDRLPQQASGGERRRLMLASAIVHQPEVLFLDEPTVGVDPVLRQKIWGRFRELADKGRSLIVTTQYVGEAAYCDYVAVLAEGRILALETPQDLRQLAYGGELVDVVFAERPGEAQIRDLQRELDVEARQWVDERSLRLIVADSGQAAPAITKWAEQREVSVIETEVPVPSFDDVFVELVERLAPSQESAIVH